MPTSTDESPRTPASGEAPVKAYAYTFTIFIPTFNRGYILERALRSAAGQTFRNFEVLVIDDGSIDNTGKLVEKWRQSADFPIQYHWQPNQGKHIAHNNALHHARGYLFVLLDSDDILHPEALSRLKKHWDGIADEEKERFAGVEGLCVGPENQVLGSEFPEPVMDVTYILTRRIHGIRGEKRNAIRTDVLKQFPYPTFKGENHVRPSLLWKRLSYQYKFRYFNEVLQKTEHQADSLSNRRFRLRMENPKAFRFYFMEEINIHAPDTRTSLLIKYHAKFIRYSLHSRIGLCRQFREVSAWHLWLLGLPSGAIGFIRDKMRMIRKFGSRGVLAK